MFAFGVILKTLEAVTRRSLLLAVFAYDSYSFDSGPTIVLHAP
jgi:hypothetical protein